MKVYLSRYSNKDTYIKGFPDKKEVVVSMGEAVKLAREKIAQTRGTTTFVGFKIHDLDENLKHSLPSY